MSTETIRAMEEWAPHRQLSLAQARNRTQMVRIMRFALVAAAIITLGVFLGFIARNAYDRALGNTVAIAGDQTVAMVNPRFTGRDGAGQLYIITSETAQQRRENEDLIDLVNPKLVDSFGGEVTAPRGLYDRVNETLDLYDDVLVVDAEGYVFNSTHAQVFPETGRVIGVEPLDGTGPLGDIRSDSYELDRDSGIVTFVGRVRTVIFDETP
jgi:lipopolysaccharide export system protein LptC